MKKRVYRELYQDAKIEENASTETQEAKVQEENKEEKKKVTRKKKADK